MKTKWLTKKLMTDDYATFNGLWKFAKIKED